MNPASMLNEWWKQLYGESGRRKRTEGACSPPPWFFPPICIPWDNLFSRTAPILFETVMQFGRTLRT